MRCTWKACVPAALALLVGSLAQAADSKEIHQTIPLDRDGRLSIENFKGSISVTTWDRPEVEMGVRIDPDGMSSDPNEMEKVALTEVRVTGSGPSVRIQSSYEHLRSHRFLGIFGFENGSLPFVHFSIQMPATAHLEIKDYKSEIRVTNLKADLKLKTYKGAVTIAGLDGGADLETYKGEMSVEFARFSQSSRLETYKGQFDVRLPKDSRFSLDADSGRRGAVNSDFELASRSMSVSGHAVSINGGGPALRFTTHRGNLRLHSS